MKGDEIVRACDQHSKETMTLRKHVIKYQNMRMVENGWSNFSDIPRVVAMKLLESTKFASPNLSIYFNFVRWLLESVVMLIFLN